MYLLVRHLESIKEFLALVQALWQHVALWKHASNQGQHAIEVLPTHVDLCLKRHHASNGIELTNRRAVMKGFLC